jgi:hypothetical protein
MFQAMLLVATTVLAACGDGSTVAPEPIVQPEAQLKFLNPAAGAALSRDSVSFWAVAGDDREVELYYRPRAGSTDSARFLRFEIDDDTRLRRPDGTLVAEGDSIRISIRVLDFSRLITQFAPSGMKFEGDPAELRLDFGNADGDYDDDGDDDEDDDDEVSNFAIWAQERVGQPWRKLTSVVEISGNFRQVQAEIRSFTNHAVAF